MTHPESSSGFDLFWIFRTLGQSWPRILLLFVLFLIMAIGFNVTGNYLINGGDQKSKTMVQVKATMVINPNLLTLHDYLDLNYYNFAWFVSSSEKEAVKILQNTGTILGREVSNAEANELDNQISVDKETGSILFTWRGRDLALVKANLTAYTSILGVHLKNHTVQRINKFLKLVPSGELFEAGFRQYALEVLPAIKDGTMQAVTFDIKKKYMESAAILPGAGYSGSFGFWVVLVLSCLYAAILTTLAWAWFSQLRKQNKLHEERS